MYISVFTHTSQNSMKQMWIFPQKQFHSSVYLKLMMYMLNVWIPKTDMMAGHVKQNCLYNNTTIHIRKYQGAPSAMRHNV